MTQITGGRAQPSKPTSIRGLGTQAILTAIEELCKRVNDNTEIRRDSLDLRLTEIKNVVKNQLGEASPYTELSNDLENLRAEMRDELSSRRKEIAK